MVVERDKRTAGTAVNQSGGEPGRPSASALQLKKQVAAADGYEAQQALLKPAKLAEALAYNSRREGKHGADWIRGVQLGIGAAASGRYDEQTTQAIARFQDDATGLRVDGKVGSKTLGRLNTAFAGNLTAKPAKPITSGVGKADALVGGGAKGNKPQQAAAAAVTPEEAIAALSDGLLPIVLTSKRALSLGTLPSWVAERAAAVTAAVDAFCQLDADDPRRTKLEATLNQEAALVASILESDGGRAKRHGLALITKASVLTEPDAQPNLPKLNEVQAYQAGLRAMGAVAADGSIAASGLRAAVVEAQDGALALFQALSVLSARATWQEGVVEPGKEGIAKANKDKDNALRGIFKDGGWGNITHDKKKGRVADWCGMFVGASMFRGAGLDQELRMGMLHTSNVMDYFRYTQKANAKRAPKSIWADGEWHDLKAYHGSRGSERKWTTRDALAAEMAGDSSPDIWPGDVVLIDHSGKKTKPQHITMVESYNAATKVLTTIEGNTGGIQAPDKKVKDSEGDEHWRKHRGPDGSGVHTRDLTNMDKASRTKHKDQHAANKAAAKDKPKGAYKGTKGSTVFGIGRASAVDFEEHSYATRAVPDEFKKLSPTEMRKLAKQRGAKAKRADKVGVKKPK